MLGREAACARCGSDKLTRLVNAGPDPTLIGSPILGFASVARSVHACEDCDAEHLLVMELRLMPAQTAETLERKRRNNATYRARTKDAPCR